MSSGCSSTVTSSALAALLVLAWRLRREVPDAALLACLAVPALAAHSFGQEYWYEIFEALFELLLSVLVLEAACLWLARRPFGARHPRLASASVLAALLALNVAARRIPDPLGYPGDLVWHRMRFADGEPYLTVEDRRFVREFLVALAPPGERPRVRFQPAGEGLFYADLDGSEISSLGAPVPRAGARLVSAACEPLGAWTATSSASCSRAPGSTPPAPRTRSASAT